MKLVILKGVTDMNQTKRISQLNYFKEENSTILLYLKFNYIILHVGLVTKSLNVCGDVNYQITCPENTVLIITGVSKLNGTVCKDSSDCPSDEGLKGILLRDCFARSTCDMNKTTTVCSYHNGGLSVKASCAKGVY